MKSQVKQRWLRALRGGKYKQTKGVLKRVKRSSDNGSGKGSFCCLGVLCDIFAKDVEAGKVNLKKLGLTPDSTHASHNEIAAWSKQRNNNLTVPSFLGETGSLPYAVTEWADLDDENPVIKPDAAEIKRLKLSTKVMDDGGEISLADCNDNAKLNFKEIASLIQKYL